MIVNLIKGKELMEKTAVCKVVESIETKDKKQIQIKFECKIENIENAKEYTDLEKNISDIPSNIDLLNPAIVDILIDERKIKNYTSEGFKDEEIPIFNAI